jgi:hypothetical protein
VSNIEQTANSFPCNSLSMQIGTRILAVELDGTDGIMVTFSDETTAGYVIEELLALRPVRERVRINKNPGTPKGSQVT